MTCLSRIPFVIALPLIFASLLISDSLNSHAGDFQADSARDIRAIKAKIRASQFLHRATFGPTMEDIETLAERINRVGYRRACTEWIDDQFATPASSHKQKILDIFEIDGIEHTADQANVVRGRHQAWWDIALRGEDQLRQKFAWALSQIFVISDSGANFNNRVADYTGNGFWLGPTVYYDEVLVDNAFGNYRDLLTQMTYSPVMGTYLSHLRNRKADVAAGRFPDENYAREIMQLFSIGLYELHQDGRLKKDDNGDLIPTYDNDEIKVLARLFTGFKMNNTTASLYGASTLSRQMLIWGPEHDNNTNYEEDPNNPGVPIPSEPVQKVLFGTTLPPVSTVPSPEEVNAEIAAGLDVIFNHENVAPFVCSRLIQRMVKSNPSRAYIRRVSRVFNNNGSGVRGDFAAVVKAILLDPEATRGQRLLRKTSPLRVEVMSRGTDYSRLREPLVRATSLIRALNPSSDYTGGLLMLGTVDGTFGQSAYRSPSVFNYYLPSFQPAGDIIGYAPSRRIPNGSLYAPEFQILDAVTAPKSTNFFISWIRNRAIYKTFVNNATYHLSTQISFDMDEDAETAQELSRIPELLEKWDLLHCAGRLSEDTKASIMDGLTEHASATWQGDIRLDEALISVLISPDCAISQ